jgi:hypothetical protein
MQYCPNLSLQNSVADPGSGDFFTPGSGIRDGKKSRSGMNIPDLTFEKYSNSLMQIRIRDLVNPEPGWKKSDLNKDPGSVTLLKN